MHQHISNSENLVSYMPCSAVVISGAFKSNHIADISLQFLTTRADQSKRDILIDYVLNEVILHVQEVLMAINQVSL